MLVLNQQSGAPNEEVNVLIDRLITGVEGEASKALITLIRVMAGEESADARRMLAIDVIAAIARAKHLALRGTPRRGRKQLSQAI